MNVAGLSQRVGPAFTLILGIACAVGVLVSMLAMTVGARRQEMGGVRTDRLVLVSTGAPSGAQSSIPRDQAILIRDLPGIRHAADLNPVAVSEVFVTMEARRRDNGQRVQFPVIGVSSGLQELYPEFHLTVGRMFRPGLNELVVNGACAGQFTDFSAGDKRRIQGVEWLVVGQFEQADTDGGCTVYADADSVSAAFRLDSYNQIVIMLQSSASYAEFVDACKDNPALKIDVRSESEVIEEQYKRLNGILRFSAFFVGSVMALGATLGAANSLYVLVDARRLEFATLLALGFDSRAIVASILCEAELLAMPGAFIGAGVAWICFNGMSASPLGFVFHLAVTVKLFLIGVGWAMAMGFIAGVLPALRGASVPVTVALRAN